LKNSVEMLFLSTHIV